MRSSRRGLVFVCFAFAASLIAPASLAAANRALILVGLTTNDTQADRLLEAAESIQDSLLKRGFDPSSVLLYTPEAGRPLRRDRVLAALAPSTTASAADETWIVLLGTSAPDRSGQPAFQITGPRLTAADLTTAVSALPGKKFVVVATSASGGFLPPLLALPNVEAVAATRDTGQISEPRFAPFWAEALAAQPSAPFATLAAETAKRVATYYQENSFAQSETARLIDRTGPAARIVEAPFADLAASASIPAGRPPADAPPPSVSGPASAPPLDIAALQIPKASGQTEVERRPADDESRALLAAARAATAGSPYAALILRTELELRVAGDFSHREAWRTRAYLRTGEALDDLGRLHLGGSSAFASPRLITARVIRPDASQLLLNPGARSARVASEVEADRARDTKAPRPLSASSSVIDLPEVTADCIVEAEWTIDYRADGELPEFYREWHFAQPYPQKSLRVSVTLPDAPRWRAFAPTLSSPQLPAPSSLSPAASARTQVWELANLPAFEPLPGDPPARSTVPWLGVSSVESWDIFAAWYRRLAAGSETTGPEIDALAAEISAAHPDRAGRLRAAYERVAALHYVAIELGVGAFRPRTPEQVWRQRYGDCKDKANLLVALLAKLGVPAEFALVNRFDSTFADFPGWQFNHALARVPAAPASGQPHDLWLDATDRLVPFGIVAPGDLGRKALVFSRDFATAAFHEITATQEPPAEWRETFSYDATASAWRIQIAATGAAETALRNLFLDQSPAQRREHARALLGWPEATVTELIASDPYDISRPAALSLTISAPADILTRRPPPPLAPGLAAYLAPGTRHRLWDEGRAWRYVRSGPGLEDIRTIPARLP